MKLTYLTILAVMVFFLYVMKSCDPETQGAAIENVTLQVALEQCKTENAKIAEAWNQDVEALMKCWDK